jgi:predicted nucleic acid-binding protein
MSGTKFLADTNILLYLLAGNESVKAFLRDDLYISEITMIELLGLKGISAQQLSIRRGLLDACYIVYLNEAIRDLAITIRQAKTIKIPDAIIAATALQMGIPLLTADKGFKKLQNLPLLIIEP